MGCRKEIAKTMTLVRRAVAVRTRLCRTNTVPCSKLGTGFSQTMHKTNLREGLSSAPGNGAKRILVGSAVEKELIHA